MQLGKKNVNCASFQFSWPDDCPGGRSRYPHAMLKGVEDTREFLSRKTHISICTWGVSGEALCGLNLPSSRGITQPLSPLCTGLMCTADLGSNSTDPSPQPMPGYAPTAPAAAVTPPYPHGLFKLGDELFMSRAMRPRRMPKPL